MAKGAPGDMSFAGGPQMAAAPPVDIPPPPPMPPPPPQMQPPPQQMPLQSVPRTGDAFEFLRSDPRYQDLRRAGAPPLSPEDIKQVILHDYGAANANPANFSPYHISVDPSGRIYERYGPGERAPHAYRSNPQAYGVSYAGPVGATPTPEAMDALRFVAGGLRSNNPNLEFLGHGEAYNRTAGTPQQASRDGRSLTEASWRSGLFENPPAGPQQTAGLAPIPIGQPPPASVAQAPPAPLANRSLTNYAGSVPQDGVQVASTSPAIPQSVSPPPPRSVPATDPSRLYQGFPRTMPGRPPSDQLWANKNPQQRYDTVQKLFNLPQQPPDGMDHYSYTGQVPPGSQIPQPPAPPAPPPPMLEAAGKRGGPEPWKPNWNAGLRMMAAVKPPTSQGLLPQAGIPPASPPPPRAPWQAARGMNRFKSAFPTA